MRDIRVSLAGPDEIEQLAALRSTWTGDALADRRRLTSLKNLPSGSGRKRIADGSGSPLLSNMFVVEQYPPPRVRSRARAPCEGGPAAQQLNRVSG